MEEEIRIAAFQWLEQQTSIYGDVLPHNILKEGFLFRGERVTILGPSGIWKPKQLALVPLSISTSPNSPYDDYYDQNGFIVYRYQGRDPQHRDNVGLREAMKKSIPLIYFYGVDVGKYFTCWPVYIIADDPANLSFTVACDNTGIAKLYSELSAEDAGIYGSEEDIFYRRKYATTTVKNRLHQSAFRTRVLSAYHEQCTFCRLKHPELLDAAHIIPDSDPRGIPAVTNGLSLCKIHHAAFDNNIIGVSPDYQIIVQEKILKEKDGPMLQHGIQQLHEKKLILPHSKRNWPSQAKLEERFTTFQRSYSP